MSSLNPGVTYKVRVTSESKVGKGSWSPVLQVATLPVSPKDCQPPSCRKAEPRCLHLEWGKINFHINNISMFTFQDKFVLLYHVSLPELVIKRVELGTLLLLSLALLYPHYRTIVD